jgi:hypothetical protein
MTDSEFISAVFSSVDPSSTGINLVRKNGRALLALPGRLDAAIRALNLYQPQRFAARLMVRGLGFSIRMGLGNPFLVPLERVFHAPESITELGGVEPGSCGVLLGSPEHKVRRAIVSYRSHGNWEVAKVALGGAGNRILEAEARNLDEIHRLVDGVPHMLGIHQVGDLTILRMPYLVGESVRSGQHRDALELLLSWIEESELKPAGNFTEWIAIESALSALNAPLSIIQQLSESMLRGVVCHGDFARWNLRKQQDGQMIALDWEWGHCNGMPGIDLVHYFLQDMRLVRRLKPADAISETVLKLSHPECAHYLSKTGWTDGALLPIIACLAYKQGAGHQENAEVLNAAVAAANR